MAAWKGSRTRLASRKRPKCAVCPKLTRKSYTRLALSRAHDTAPRIDRQAAAKGQFRAVGLNQTPIGGLNVVVIVA
jgi:hypothetical protein